MVRSITFNARFAPDRKCTLEMEMRKLHMGTMSYGYDSMDEVAHQLAIAFGVSPEQSER